MALTSRLTPYIELAKRYEAEDVQTAARRNVPLHRLMADAQQTTTDILENYNNVARGSALSEQQPPDKAALLKHCLLLQLLKWFKTEFFMWFDHEKCTACNIDCVAVGNATPTSEERRYGGERIEVYRCPQCQRQYRFPRYNDPVKLLETRRGRCGEWANAFTLCCRACGFDARFVLDFTDHVWTEVWSELEGRWLHCDPCENECDKPLLYEAGWGKRLNYVFAFSRDEVVDVTWRYTSKPHVLCRRRKLMSEPELLNAVHVLNQTHYGACVPAQRASIVLNRRVGEVVEFINGTSRTASAGELFGRSSGSLAWRLSRGETGASAAGVNKKFTFQLSDDAVVEKVRFEYNVVTDKYAVHYDDRENSTYSRWSACVYSADNIERKEEQDWHMAYLCRAADSDCQLAGDIQWRFSLGSLSGRRKIEEVIVHAKNTACFETGCAKWTVAVIPTNNESGSDTEIQWIPVDFSAMQNGYNCTNLIAKMGSVDTVVAVRATLSGGQDKIGWQQAQLFRSSTKNEEDKSAADDGQLIVSIKMRQSGLD